MKILIKRLNNKVSIMTLVKGADAEDAVSKWREVHSDYISHEESEVALPDRTFRDAWGHDLKVDMPRARAIHMDKIRIARDEKLVGLDIETLRGNDVQVAKQKLRDIPQSFDLSVAKTPDSLKLLWPEELK